MFRIKAERYRHDLFTDKNITNPELIKAAILEKPSKEVRKKQTWRLGNTEYIEKNAVLFAFGKVLQSKRDVYDEKQGNFTEVDDTDAPHTYIIIDLETQVCAIAHKSNMKNIEKNLAKVLTSTDICQEQSTIITINPINDPDDFIRLIENAEKVSMFEMTFSPPNPFDVEKDFHRPMESLIQHSNAEKGRTRINGKELEKDVIEDLARSAASTGNDAKAKCQMPGELKATLKKMDGSQKTVQSENITTEEEKKNLLKRIRDVYYQVRGKIK